MFKKSFHRNRPKKEIAPVIDRGEGQITFSVHDVSQIGEPGVAA